MGAQNNIFKPFYTFPCITFIEKNIVLKTGKPNPSLPLQNPLQKHFQVYTTNSPSFNKIEFILKERMKDSHRSKMIGWLFNTRTSLTVANEVG